MTTTSAAAMGGAPIPFCRVEISREARAAAARVLANGWITTGPEVAAFESEFAELVGARHAVAVSSCTAGLELALRALDLPRGAGVLTPSLTFSGAVHAIVHAGLRPVFVDIDPATLMPRPDHVQAARRRSRGAEAMVVLHFAGAPAPVQALAAAAGLPLSRVIEDAAHALWTRVGDRSVGSISAATCFSFYATKNLPIGEGGMVTTDDLRMATHLRCARLHGMTEGAWRRYLPGGSWQYDVTIDGIKANMTDVAAAIGRAQLRHLAAWQARRERLARRYSANLAGVPGILPPISAVAGRHAWHLYVIRVGPGAGVHRDRVATSLAAEGIGCSVHFIPVHRLTHFRRLLGDAITPLPGTETAAAQVLSLPLSPAMSEAEVDRVCEAVGYAVGASNPQTLRAAAS